jgi:hypothetical protein
MAARRESDEPTSVEIERVARRYDLAKSLVPVAWIAALWIPIQAAVPIARALAGKHTDLTVTISISIAFTVALGAGVASLLRKNKEQRDELRRQRRRITTLEQELGG